MHTRSAKDKITGKFTVTVTDWNGDLCFVGEFDDVREADRAAAREERLMTLRMQNPVESVEMTDDELLAELGV